MLIISHITLVRVDQCAYRQKDNRDRYISRPPKNFAHLRFYFRILDYPKINTKANHGGGGPSDY